MLNFQECTGDEDLMARLRACKTHKQWLALMNDLRADGTLARLAGQGRAIAPPAAPGTAPAGGVKRPAPQPAPAAPATATASRVKRRRGAIAAPAATCATAGGVKRPAPQPAKHSQQPRGSRPAHTAAAGDATSGAAGLPPAPSSGEPSAPAASASIPADALAAGEMAGVLMAHLTGTSSAGGQQAQGLARLIGAYMALFPRLPAEERAMHHSILTADAAWQPLESWLNGVLGAHLKVPWATLVAVSPRTQCVFALAGMFTATISAAVAVGWKACRRRLGHLVADLSRSGWRFSCVMEPPAVVQVVEEVAGRLLLRFVWKGASHEFWFCSREQAAFGYDVLLLKAGSLTGISGQALEEQGHLHNQVSLLLADEQEAQRFAAFSFEELMQQLATITQSHVTVPAGVEPAGQGPSSWSDGGPAEGARDSSGHGGSKSGGSRSSGGEQNYHGLYCKCCRCPAPPPTTRGSASGLHHLLPPCPTLGTSPCLCLSCNSA